MWFWNLFGGKKHMLRSPLDAEECMRRLEELVKPEWVPLHPHEAALGEAVTGMTYKRRFTVWRRTYLGYGLVFRNSFQTVARGSVTKMPDGTLISVRFSVHRLVQALCVFAALIPAFAATPTLGTSGPSQILAQVWQSYSDWVGSGFVWWFVALPCIYGFGRLLSIGDDQFLLTFLEKTLLATEVHDQL